MSGFEHGTRVVVIENNQVFRGEIRTSVDALEISTVVMEDGTVKKVPYAYIGIESEAKAPEKETRGKTVRIKSEITITPDEFQKIAVRAVLDKTKDHPLFGIASTMMVAEIHKALFVEGEND